jgi:hypothetical protein
MARGKSKCKLDKTLQSNLAGLLAERARQHVGRRSNNNSNPPDKV